MAARRGVHPLRQVELGRWSGSTAQDPDLAPAPNLLRRHCLRVGVMPAAYAPEAKEARVIAILTEQMTALRALYAASRAPGGARLALTEGYARMSAWPDVSGAE